MPTAAAAPIVRGNRTGLKKLHHSGSISSLPQVHSYSSSLPHSKTSFPSSPAILSNYSPSPPSVSISINYSMDSNDSYAHLPASSHQYPTSSQSCYPHLPSSSHKTPTSSQSCYPNLPSSTHKTPTKIIYPQLPSNEVGTASESDESTINSPIVGVLQMPPVDIT